MTREAVGGWVSAMLALACATAPLAAGRADGAEGLPADAVPVEAEAGLTAEAAAEGPGDVTVRVSRSPAGLQVEGRCVVEAPAAVVGPAAAVEPDQFRFGQAYSSTVAS